MIKHILKVIWNRRRDNFLLITEMIFSFGVLFVVVSLFMSSAKRYMIPLGFDYRNIIEFSMWGGDSINTFEVKRQLEKFPETAGVTFSSFGNPYQESEGSYEMRHKNKVIGSVHFYDADNEFAKVMSIRISEGRWFNNSDNGAAFESVIINKLLKNALFGNESAINKTIEGRGKIKKIIGVVENYKKNGEFSEENFVEFNRMKSRHIGGNYCSVLIKTKRRASASFEEKLRKFGSAVNPAGRKIIKTMEKQREQYISPVIKQLILYSTLGAFLILNVTLGLFGVLWYNISRRKQEIGLKRALGADRRGIFKQITGEILFVTSISILLGTLLLIQFPLLRILKIQTSIYYLSLGFSAVIIYMLVLLCASYPGLLASKIEPAAALHED